MNKETTLQMHWVMSLKRANMTIDRDKKHSQLRQNTVNVAYQWAREHARPIAHAPFGDRPVNNCFLEFQQNLNLITYHPLPNSARALRRSTAHAPFGVGSLVPRTSQKLIYKCSTDPARSNLENCIFVGLLLVDCRPTVIKVVGI